MAIQWGSTVNGQRVGIDITRSPSSVGTGTSRVTLTVRYYSGSVNRGFNDNQTLTLSGAISGTINFNFSTPFGSTTNRLVATRTLNVNTSYAGTVSRSFTARITGQHSGGNPQHTRSHTVPRRPAASPSAPGRPSASNLRNNSVRITWAAPSNNGGAAIQGYRFQRATNSGFTSGVASGTWTGTSRDRTHSGLNAGTTYWFRIRAYNSAGNGPWSTSRSFTTHSVPARVGRPTTSNVGQTTGRIAWNAPSNGGSAITNYNVQLSTSSSFNSIAQSFTQTTRNRTFNNLNPEVTYYARVRANNTYGAGQWSLVANFRTFYEDLTNYPTPAPILEPASTYNTGEPVVNVNIVEPHPFAGEVNHITYELGTNSAITQNRVTGSVDSPGANVTVPVQVQGLPLQGTWYMRARRSGSRDLNESSWSSVASFTVSHAPSAFQVGPIGGTFVATATNRSFSFTAMDPWPGDQITAYQIEVYENASGAPIHDTGKVVFGDPRALGGISATIPVASLAESVELRWRVRVWDSTDVASPYSGYEVFTIVPPPRVTITAPEADSNVNSGMPTIAWGVELTAGRTIASSSIVITDRSNGQEAWRTNVGEGVTTVTPPRPVLQNETEYNLRVTSVDSRGLSGSQTIPFATAYPAPDPLDYDFTTEHLEDEGYVLIDWASSDYDESLERWEVYRRELPSGAWERIASVEDQGTPYYKDYLFSAGKTYMYNVIQVADRSGESLQSPLGRRSVGGQSSAETRTVTPRVSDYWILVPEAPELSTLVPNVTSNPTTLEVEKEVFNIIGRGRHVDYGDVLGHSGTLEFQVRQPESISLVKIKIEEIVRARLLCYLRDPFGELLQVALDDPSWTPLAGTGSAQMGDMSLPYYEVS